RARVRSAGVMGITLTPWPSPPAVPLRSVHARPLSELPRRGPRFSQWWAGAKVEGGSMRDLISRRQWAGSLGLGVLALRPDGAQANGGAGAEQRAGFKNVKEFGARGDGKSDDTAAIQAAVNHAEAPYSAANRGTIFFPPGLYRISAPITFEAALCNIAFLGAPGAKLIGGFGDAMLKRSPNSPFGGVHVIENLILENNHASGKGIMLHSCVSGKIVN